MWGRTLKPDNRVVLQPHRLPLPLLGGYRVDPGKVVKMNELHGGYDDPEARIIPVKVHRAVQITTRRTSI